MKKLKVHYIDGNINTAEIIHSVLNKQEKHQLQYYLWLKEQDKPEVFFSLAHDQYSLLLKFFVREKEIRSGVTKINGPVWEDSCVEFFVSFDGSNYYNFELNCIGTILAAFGNNRNHRSFLSETVLKTLETHTELTKNHNGFYWEITIIIPKDIFIHDTLPTWRGIVCKGNFYKCGDGLSQPHFLSWNNIESEIPDFHLSKYFGELLFL
jgi:hypothetical protein